MKSLRIKDAPLALLSSIFFIWGLITVSSNSLIPHYKEAFDLDYKMAMLFPMAFFITRVTVSLPTSLVMLHLGYKTTLKYCLIGCLLGCLSMAYLVLEETLITTVLGILLMASGISAIQVVSSPYVSLLDKPEKSVLRQSIATASNSIGTVLGPLILAAVILIATTFGWTQTAEHVSILFVCIATYFAALIVCFHYIHLPDIQPSKKTKFRHGISALCHNQSFRTLAIALILYVGVEVSFGTYTISYLADEAYGQIGLVSATQWITCYWMGMFLGRVGFARLGAKVNVTRLLTCCCALAILISVFAMTIHHVSIGYLMLSVGLLNATLYPIIYSKALHAAGAYREQGAAVLIMCSIGGVLLPLIQAIVIDAWNLHTSFIAPAIAYLAMVALYYKVQHHESALARTAQNEAGDQR